MTMITKREVETHSWSLLERWRTAKEHRHSAAKESIAPTGPELQPDPAQDDVPIYADTDAPTTERLRSMASALAALRIQPGEVRQEPLAIDGPEPDEEQPHVFVDASGRRRRTMMAISWVLSVILGLFIALAIAGLYQAVIAGY